MGAAWARGTERAPAGAGSRRDARPARRARAAHHRPSAGVRPASRARRALPAARGEQPGPRVHPRPRGTPHLREPRVRLGARLCARATAWDATSATSSRRRCAMFFGAYLERIREKEADRGVLRLVSRDGQERLWAYRNVLMRLPDREPYVLGHAVDITDRLHVGGAPARERGAAPRGVRGARGRRDRQGHVRRGLRRGTRAPSASSAPPSPRSAWARFARTARRSPPSYSPTRWRSAPESPARASPWACSDPAPIRSGSRSARVRCDGRATRRPTRW